MMMQLLLLLISICLGEVDEEVDPIINPLLPQTIVKFVSKVDFDVDLYWVNEENKELIFQIVIDAEQFVTTTCRDGQRFLITKHEDDQKIQGFYIEKYKKEYTILTIEDQKKAYNKFVDEREDFKAQYWEENQLEWRHWYPRQPPNHYMYDSISPGFVLKFHSQIQRLQECSILPTLEPKTGNEPAIEIDCETEYCDNRGTEEEKKIYGLCQEPRIHRFCEIVEVTPEIAAVAHTSCYHEKEWPLKNLSLEECKQYCFERNYCDKADFYTLDPEEQETFCYIFSKGNTATCCQNCRPGGNHIIQCEGRQRACSYTHTTNTALARGNDVIGKHVRDGDLTTSLRACDSIPKCEGFTSRDLNRFWLKSSTRTLQVEGWNAWVKNTCDIDEYEIEVVCDSPRVFSIHNFLTNEECDAIISAAFEKGFKKLGVYTDKNQDQRHGNFRTSTGTWLERDTNVIADYIIKRIADAVKINEELLMHEISLEKMQVVRYQENQHYAPHVDYRNTKFNSRFLTFIMYLTTPIEGGETEFPEANCWGEEGPLVIPAVKGSAMFFYNTLPDGNADINSRHGGKHVIQGEKIMTNLWIWDPFVPLDANEARSERVFWTPDDDRTKNDFADEINKEEL